VEREIVVPATRRQPRGPSLVCADRLDQAREPLLSKLLAAPEGKHSRIDLDRAVSAQHPLLPSFVEYYTQEFVRHNSTAMRLIQLADYAEPDAGRFIPMLRETIGLARSRGWEAEVVFTPLARDQGWLDGLREDAIPVRFTASGSRSDLASMVETVLEESQSPTLLHTNFTDFDLPALAAARRRPGTAVIWHLHTPLGEGPRAALRNAVKFALARRGVSRVICATPEIARSARLRGLQRQKLVLLGEEIEPDRESWDRVVLGLYEQALRVN
jgi:hypothetical protein